MCQDELCHARALSICERLVSKFWDELEFKFSWWLFTNLDYAANAAEAADVAAQAEMVLFATASTGELPERVKSWIEMWVNRRPDHGGALVCYTADEQTLSAQNSPVRGYLRQIALRGRMDFLSDIPEHLAQTIPEAPNWLSDRAGAMGPIMDGILHNTGTPPSPMPL